MKKNQGFLTILVGVLVVSLFAVYSLIATQQVQAKFLEKYDLPGLDTKTVIQKLDGSNDEPKELISSITGKYLTLKDGESKVVLRVPKDSFYLSFAPCESQVHRAVS